MSTLERRNWQAVQEEVLRRIHAREWKPGELIPNEAALAEEFGCARATVNRALRTIAESGLIDRRRKAGTRVALTPAARATLTIPIIRQEITDRGQKYGYSRLSRRMEAAPAKTLAEMRLAPGARLLHVRALHLADSRPHALEDRWINPAVVRGADDEPFDRISANEWLLTNTPYTSGEIAFSASAAGQEDARLLECDGGDALFVIERLTWDGDAAVTSVRLLFAPGHQMRTGL